MIQSPDDTTASPDDSQVTGRAPAGGGRVQRTVNFDRETLDRARAAATYLAQCEPESGIRSLADIVNPAVAQRVAELEARFNHGLPFQPVFRMPPGRRPAPARLNVSSARDGGPAQPQDEHGPEHDE